MMADEAVTVCVCDLYSAVSVCTLAMSAELMSSTSNGRIASGARARAESPRVEGIRSVLQRVLRRLLAPCWCGELDVRLTALLRSASFSTALRLRARAPPPMDPTSLRPDACVADGLDG